MKKNFWVIIFFVVLFIHLLALAMDLPQVATVTKPMLMPAVTGHFITSVSNSSPFRLFVIAALFFSWAGDVLLMFQQQNSIFFLLGLSSFLIAHLFYIFFFHRIRKEQNIKSQLWTLLVVASYYSVLIALLNPWLGEMRLPVRVYGLVISFMLLLALHMSYISNRTAGRSMLTGAVLFVISDSILAINKFWKPVPAGDVMIMLTYGLAQFFLIYGAVRYLSVDRFKKSNA
ncbi:MAG: lysoplasmalogenase [Citrobacter freundii]|nr:MAG: lysoplasmalogenase [Citrobacter freundii]